MSWSTVHIFIVSYPVQGQINPLLRLAKCLASNAGFLVTFSTASSAGKKIIKANDITTDHLYPVGDGFLRFEFFDIDFHGPRQLNQFEALYPKVELGGCKRVPEMLRRLADGGRPVTCLVNGLLVPWVSDIAEDHRIPLATMWAQSCASFLSFYYHYNKLVPFPTKEDPYCDVQIPSLPLLKWDEIHSFLHPSYPFPTKQMTWLRQFQNLDKPFCILFDTFDELEQDTVQFTSNLFPSLKTVGPLFRDHNYSSATCPVIGADPCKADSACLDWLDSKPPRSVVYVCFGSLAHIKQEQVDEIAHGILNVGAPFLWVMRSPDPGSSLKAHTLPELVGPDKGLVVEYSPQEKVLKHPSVACFLTHCGWNSTVEALASGVPMVAFPQWGDQLTNAKFLADVFKVSSRMGRGEHEDKVVPREEVERCIREVTMGPMAQQMKSKAMMWKDKAEKACQEGGSSNRNMRGFVEEIRRRSGQQLQSIHNQME